MVLTYQGMDMAGALSIRQIVHAPKRTHVPHARRNITLTLHTHDMHIASVCRYQVG